MIILRSKSFSSKKKTDEETEFQKKSRKHLATTAGILAGGTTGLLADTIIAGKTIRNQTKVIDKSIEHLEKIDAEKKKVDKKILNKVQEVLDNPKIKKEGALGQQKVKYAANKLLNENAKQALDKLQRLNAAKERLEKRIAKKGLKARGISLLGSAALGTAAGLAANHGIKKQNKKVNRIRRHIED